MTIPAYLRQSVPLYELVDENNQATPAFSQWLQTIDYFQHQAKTSGPSSLRPTKAPSGSLATRWVGMAYFDTTKGYPVWLKSINPDVWVNAQGNPV
jgi:hypothetical protein